MSNLIKYIFLFLFFKLFKSFFYNFFNFPFSLLSYLQIELFKISLILLNFPQSLNCFLFRFSDQHGTCRDGKNTRARGYPRIKSAMDSYYPRVINTRGQRVAGILIPAYKRVGYGYHTIRTRGYPLPAKKVKLKFNLYFIKLNLIKIRSNNIFYYVKFNYNYNLI